MSEIYIGIYIKKGKQQNNFYVSVKKYRTYITVRKIIAYNTFEYSEVV